MKKFFKRLILLLVVICELFETSCVYALTKEESVYAKLDSTGQVDSVSVSEHLFNFSGNTVNDKTILNNIKNISDDGTFKQDGNNIIWKTDKKDIFYQGSYDEELPISINVKYFLNNEEKNINDMLGKKGKVKIVLTYKNNSSEKMSVNGKNETMYVPYIVVTTSILDASKNRNIKVTNGKVINNGINSLITAVSSPGLYESLDVDKLKDFNKVEISYDTDSFELNAIYSLATTNLIDDNNTSIINQMNDLYKSIGLLQSNMDTIVDASKKLSNGSNQMNDGITELNKKMQELINKYKDYRYKDKDELKDELIKIINKNIKEITPALEEDIITETTKIIKENQDELEAAAISYTKKNTKDVIDEEINNVIQNLDIEGLIERIINNNLKKSLKNDSEINAMTNSLKKNINKKLNTIIEKEYNELNKSIKYDIKDSEVEELAQKYGVTYEQALGIANEVKDKTINTVKTNVKESNFKETLLNELNDEDYLSNLINEYIKKINDIINESINNDEVIEKYINELKEKILEEIKKDLSDDSIYITNEVKKYISGIVDKIIERTVRDLSNTYTEEYTGKVVKNIVEKEFSEENIDAKLRQMLDMHEEDINTKIAIIDDTVNTLSTSLNKLNDGSKQMSKGMNALSKGLDKYNKEGINKLNKLVNGDVKNVQKRIDAVLKLGKDNNMIDSISKNTNSNSKIIFMIDSIEMEEEKKIEEKKEENKSSLWDKIKGLFN